MNLIEQLGGYEKACKACDKEIKEGGYPYDLISALLEHRRANNIYEVGDSIITNDEASNGKVYVIERNSNDVHFKIRSKEGVRYCGRWRIERHATDEEIKAGKRL